MASVVAALLLAFAFTDLVPADVRFWATLSFSTLALGLFFCGSAALVLARARAGGSL